MEKKDYYLTLGVSHEESPGGIRAAYRDRVKKLHPDLAGEESTRAFQELTEAYNVLSDPQRRREYNRGLEARSPAVVTTGRAPDRRRAPAAAWWPLASFLGSAPGSARLDPLDFEVLLTREEAARGCVVPLGIPVFERCPRCRGAGEAAGDACIRCQRTGVVEREVTVEVPLPADVPSGTRFEVALGGHGVHPRSLGLRVFVTRSR